ncbi:MAG: type I DNA topoisomerase [Ectothiorhodospiraceae bacterium AqS1]|nr:type I DNA topoisomerase [Ectothiorhodospiraceae bacterium AqS1]
MARNVLVVESPTKVRTIGKYLGSDYKILSSYGHVRDLDRGDGAVDPNRGFEMRYAAIDRNKKHVDQIVKALVGADALYLATDPDREGEAIAWHLLELLRKRRSIGSKSVYRVVFNEITKEAVQRAVANPRTISDDLVNAQQARRALDRLFGFTLSPLLWGKISPSLSAGRVQSPALRMIVEREEEIEAFERREYWTIGADLQSAGSAFPSRLVRLEGEKLEQFSITEEAQANRAKARIEGLAGGFLCVHAVEKKQRRRNPPPPFTTSTLQQEAARKLRFSSKKTMQVAQKLYEGIDIGGAPEGLITYMRTDSTALAQSAVAEIRAYIGKELGADQVPERPRIFPTKSRNAQEAHEAIRPTSAMRTPRSIEGMLNLDQAKLYALIWKRAVACQMQHAVFDTVSVEFTCGGSPLPDSPPPADILRSNGSTLVKPGFLAVWDDSSEGGRDGGAGAGKDGKGEKEQRLPELEQGMRIDLLAVRPEQHFTEPPPRYSEASLVKALEEHGLGRPSTYTSILSVLQERRYVELIDRRFHPTDIGRLTSGYLSRRFADYVDYDFTARMEGDLDAVSRGEREWKSLLERFWIPFSELVGEEKGRGAESARGAKRAAAGNPGEAVESAPDAGEDRGEAGGVRENTRILGSDPATGREVSVRVGRFGTFVQLGTRDDEEKPKFVSLLPGQRMHTITFEQAMRLLDFPCTLGESAEGEPVQLLIGRFGPYIKCGGKSASIPDGVDPMTVDLESALRIVSDSGPRSLGTTDEGESITIGKGRFGPYVRYGDKFVSIPKDEDPSSLTVERALELIAKKKAADAARRIKLFEGTTIEVMKSRFGPVIVQGSSKAYIPKGVDPIDLPLDEAKRLLDEASAKGAGKKTGKTRASAKKGAAKSPASKAAASAKKKGAKSGAREKDASDAASDRSQDAFSVSGAA